VHAGTVEDHVGRFRDPGLVDAEPLARMAEVIGAFR